MGLFFLSPPVTIAIFGVVVGATIAYHVTKNMKEERIQMEALVTSLKELVTEERRLKEERQEHYEREEPGSSKRLKARGISSAVRPFKMNDGNDSSDSYNDDEDDNDDDDLYRSPSHSHSASRTSVLHVRRVSNPKNNTDSETDDLRGNVPTDYSEVISDTDDYEEVEYVSRPLKRQHIKQT